MSDDKPVFITGRQVVELHDQSDGDPVNAHELEGYNRHLLEETNEEKREQQTKRLLRARRIKGER